MIEIAIGGVGAICLVIFLVWAIRPIKHEGDGIVVRLGERIGATQDVLVDAQAVRKQVREEGYKFEGVHDYIRKYHGFKYFNFLSADYDNQDWGQGSHRIWVCTIRLWSPFNCFVNWVRGYSPA